MNLATGIQGRGRFSHLPAMLEMAGVAYTGPDPVSYARAQDRYSLLSLLESSDISVPRFELIQAGSRSRQNLQYPLAVRPRP